jgi:hypothetical protein
MTRSIFLAAMSTAACVATAASADVDTELTVNGGSSASINMNLQVTTFLGTASESDSASAGVTGNAQAILGSGDSEPFDQLSITDLSLDLSNTSLDFEFYCVPIFGCSVDVELAVTNFNLGVAETVSAPVAANGNATFNNALFNPSFSFAADIGGLISAEFSGDFDEVAEQAFACNLQASNQSVSVTNFSIDEVIYDVDAKLLPSGVDAVRIVANVNLGNVTMSGTYDPPAPDCPGDFNGDGLVDGGDIGSLLALWGVCGGCPEDLDGNGQIDGGDVGLFLSYWGQCP